MSGLRGLRDRRIHWRIAMGSLAEEIEVVKMIKEVET
jgi:hypothetical protein